MITLKTTEDIENIRAGGRIINGVFRIIRDNLREGISTLELDELAANYIAQNNAKPSFLGYRGYPAALCISIDEQVVHGIPSKRRIMSGEIVSVDVGVLYNGFHSDAARTFALGKISAEKQRLIDVTEQCFRKGVEQVRPGARIGDISWAVQSHAEANGFSVVRALSGHGVGRELHEDPSIPNYGTKGRGIRLERGMILAIEPMINAGKYDVVFMPDGWTVVTKDKMPSAHYENTVAVTENGYEILT